jgi:hypothetical protein
MPGARPAAGPEDILRARPEAPAVAEAIPEAWAVVKTPAVPFPAAAGVCPATTGPSDRAVPDATTPEAAEAAAGTEEGRRTAEGPAEAPCTATRARSPTLTARGTVTARLW